MSIEDTELEALTHDLAQRPAEFLAAPRLAKGGKIPLPSRNRSPNSISAVLARLVPPISPPRPGRRSTRP